MRAVVPAANAVDPVNPANRVEITEASLGVMTPDGTGLARMLQPRGVRAGTKTEAHELALYFEVDFPYGA